MRVVMVGSGKVGAYLARELSAGGHAIVMIEKREDRAIEMADVDGVLAVHGDGTDVDLLRDLNLKPTDLVLALTGIDEDNFVVCHLARTAFDVKNTLARLNDPRNRHTFEALEIPVVSVADLLVRFISRDLGLATAMNLAPLARGSAGLIEVVVPENARIRKVSDVNGPHSRILAIVRDGVDIVIPGDRTELRPLDQVLLVAHSEHEEETLARLTGGDLPIHPVPSPHVLIVEAGESA